MGTSNKGQWYKLLIKKTDEAIDNGYYFEAIFIEYMIIDDRIKSLSKLAGVNLMRPDGNPKMMGQLLDDLKAAKKKQTVPHWKQLDIPVPLADDKFLEAIKQTQYPREASKRCERAPRKLIHFEKSAKTGKIRSKYYANDTTLIGQIKEWVTLRNHWMHAAGNDKLTKEEYEAEITPLAVDGITFARELCDVTARIKKGIAQEEKRQKENIL